MNAGAFTSVSATSSPLNAGAFASVSSTSSPLNAGAFTSVSATSSPLNAGAFVSASSTSSPLNAGAFASASSTSSPLNAGAFASALSSAAKIALLYAANASAPLKLAAASTGAVTTSVFVSSDFVGASIKIGATPALKLIGLIIIIIYLPQM